MSFLARLQNVMDDTGTTAAAGTAGTVFPGETLSMGKVEPGTLSARMVATIVTEALTMTPSWQVSDDDDAWEDFVVASNEAATALTSSATINLEGPKSLSSHRYARAVFTGAGATATTGDFYRISYDYLKPVSYVIDA